MKKIGIPLITSIIVFLLVNAIPLESLFKHSEIHVSISARVLDDDSFQLFYVPKDQSSYSEEYSFHRQIKGSTDIQKISFDIPTDAIKKIRLDIGQNKKQRPIVFNSITFKSLNTSESYDILDIFTPNSYIQYENGEFVLSADKRRKYAYDPYLISKPDFENLIENIVSSRVLFWIVVTAILAFIIALVTFYLLRKYSNQKFVVSGMYILFFVLILISPSLVEYFNIEIETSLVEKRELAAKPELKLSRDFPRNFENYYNDNFSLRDVLISWSGLLKTQIFRVSPKPELVQVGKDDFLFYNIPYYSNSYKYPKTKLENIYQEQAEQKEKLAQRGIKYILGFWPNKHSIYSDKFPFSMQLQVKTDYSLADQVYSYFQNRGMNLFDVREALLNSKSKNQLYYKLDTHWNDDGAYEAYRSFCKQTFTELGLIPYDKDVFNIAYRKWVMGDLINMLGLSKNTLYSDVVPKYTLKKDQNEIKKIEPADLPKRAEVFINAKCKNEEVVLVFHDSYTNALKKFLSLHYKKIVFVWSYPIENHVMDKALIVNQVKPDIIINSCVERNIRNLLLIREANTLCH